MLVEWCSIERSPARFVDDRLQGSKLLNAARKQEVGLERRAGVGVEPGGELAQLRDALSGALGGAGASRLLAGEAGIGKSRLIQELSRHARSHDVTVLTGGCADAEGAPPYLPFVEALVGRSAR